MIVDDLVKNPGCWLSMAEDTGIAISSRVRLARNLRDFAFPGWAGENECVRLCDNLQEILVKLPGLNAPLFFEMGKLERMSKEILKERHLISSELAERGAGSALVVAADEQVAVMVNEEDHLRLQAMSPGMNLEAVWRKVDQIDSEIEKHVKYAFSSRLGHLTACPSNVGTGLRASVMVHLSGLRWMYEIELVIKGLENIGLAVRGLLGEGTEACGNMFQISNQATLGESEETTIKRLAQVVGEVVQHESNARERLLESKRMLVLDQIGRAFGILRHACVLPSKEAVDLLSDLKLGVEFGMVRDATAARLNEIMLLTQPGHLQKMAGKILGTAERDEVRARIVRRELKGVGIRT